MSSIQEESGFETAVKGLISHINQLIEDVKIHSPISKADSEGYAKYCAVFNKSKASPKHLIPYRELFAKNRVPILSPNDDGMWLKVSCSIKCSDKTPNVKIDLSFFYQRALHHAEVVKKSLEGYSTQGHKGLLLPDNIRLMLLKALLFAIESAEDKALLKERIAELEQRLQTLMNNGLPATKPSVPAPTPTAEAPSPLGGLEGIFKMVSGFMQNSGMQLPSAPGPGQQGGGPQGAGGPPAFDMNALGDVFKKLTEGDSINKLIAGVVSGISQTGLLPTAKAPGAASVGDDASKKDPMSLGFLPVPPVPGTVTTGIVADTEYIEVPSSSTPSDAPPSNTTS